VNPSAMEDLWTVVRLAAEGSDWKRDQGETLCAWAQRRLRSGYVPRETVIEECAKYIESHANACLPGSAADDQNWPFALQSCANEMRRDLLKDRSGCEPRQPVSTGDERSPQNYTESQ
jgi:hypothetical protein